MIPKFSKPKESKYLEPSKEDVRYPNIEVKLVGTDGNAFAIIGRVTKALKRAKVSSQEVSRFQAEAMSGDYNNLLATAMKWISVS